MSLFVQYVIMAEPHYYFEFHFPKQYRALFATLTRKWSNAIKVPLFKTEREKFSLHVTWYLHYHHFLYKNQHQVGKGIHLFERFCPMVRVSQLCRQQHCLLIIPTTDKQQTLFVMRNQHCWKKKESVIICIGDIFVEFRHHLLKVVIKNKKSILLLERFRPLDNFKVELFTTFHHHPHRWSLWLNGICHKPNKNQP